MSTEGEKGKDQSLCLESKPVILRQGESRVNLEREVGETLGFIISSGVRSTMLT